MLKTTSVKLNDDVYARLSRLSEMTARPKSYYIHIALEEKLDELEMVYLAKSRSESLKQGKSSVVDWEDLKEENGL